MDGESLTLTYTAQMSRETGPVMKFTSVYPANTAAGLPLISAVVVALDPGTGRTAAILDGTTITTRWTAAASALAVTELSDPDATVLTILGSGVQAREHTRPGSFSTETPP
ncbi:ornithine cyclodeaminase/alanine dehydrogenase-like protein (mu-crystallin family) [Thermocatellispora tengchongensis]|uniref:Ornithine cyclodeaminase/alanine dehydrogenase-like protein (Mu-crystallin family) n=1 Tax=Thermocatellispora tengchongensis TaxID=1073253 RepID=A0A840PI23_9ACTN|nr:hypothetical protein [Thermocatellispora tengchongensis]MBB5137451.1 ornithine cyclodeaminase/alanine dehydrogenase-like protein (mu-crystallin family) [Thermocatellispora tengchongensis]